MHKLIYKTRKEKTQLTIYKKYWKLWIYHLSVSFKGPVESEHQSYGKNYLEVLKRKYKIKINNIILK